MSAELFEDMRVNGLKSQDVKEVRKHDALSLAVGSFKHAVEIMFIEPCKEKETEDMETGMFHKKSCLLISHFATFSKCISKIMWYIFTFFFKQTTGPDGMIVNTYNFVFGSFVFH